MSDIHPVQVNAASAFFGFMGVSMALVLASKFWLIRLWSRLWHCQSWHWNQQHFDLEACSSDEITYPSCYGWYFGHLRHDCGCDHQSERYPSWKLVKYTGEYTSKNGYSHMASGLVCGFSCIVLDSWLRLQDIRLERWAMQVSERMPSKKSCLWVWFWCWFLERHWHCMVW